MNLRKLLFLLYSFLFTIPGYGQLSEDLFKRTGPETGLRNNSIITITEDNRGYLWFGTWFGLYRKDGSGVQVYSSNPTDALSLNSNKIVSTLFDSKGRLWVGTLRGSLYRYQYGSDHFTKIQYLSNPVPKIMCGRY